MHTTTNSRRNHAGHQWKARDVSSIRALVIDDFGVVRCGVELLLDAESDIESVGEAEGIEDGLANARTLKPDVVVLDLVMQGRISLEAIPAFREVLPEASVVVLSSLDDGHYARAAFNAGASAFVLKEGSPDKLFEAVREAAAGGRYLDPAVGARLALEECDGVQDSGSIGEREREVVRLLALGHTCVEVAARIGRSPRTIEAYRARIMEKLGLDTRADLVRYALAEGLLEPLADESTDAGPQLRSAVTP
jgi:DNA-binding NarL/FixJ family response regulator